MLLQGNPVHISEAIQLAVLDCVADDPVLSDRLVLRGSAALRYVYKGPRPSGDVDFLVEHLEPPMRTSDAEEWHRRICTALRAGLPELLRPYSVWADSIAKNLKVHVNTDRWRLRPRRVPWGHSSVGALRVLPPEFIVADKIGAIYQQQSRGVKKRPHDFLDIAHFCQTGGELDLDEVVRYLAERRAGPVVAMIRDVQTFVNNRGWLTEYESLRASLDDGFIEAPIAYERVARLCTALMSSLRV